MENKEFNLGSLEIKRFYFDGKLEINCPKCKSKMVRDFGSDYLSYPEFGKEEALWFYCDECGDEYEMPGIITAKVNVSYDLDKLKRHE